jgi:hypothetical protein
MRGKEYSEEGEGMGDKYTDEYFEELKYANQWRPQSTHSSSAHSSSAQSINSSAMKHQSMDALFYEKEEEEPGEVEDESAVVSVKNDGQNDPDLSVKSETQSSQSRPKSADPRRKSTGEIFNFSSFNFITIIF